MSKEILQQLVAAPLTPRFANLREFDVLVQPDVGGRYEPNFPLDRTITIAGAADRNLPIIEPQRTAKNARIDSEKYLGDVAKLQRIFDRTLGINVNEAGLIRNYNPVLARAMSEQLETQEEKERFRRYEMMQVMTALKERYHVARNTAVYSIDENLKLRSQDFPIEVFDRVLERGIVYRKKLGSPDSEREQKELEGFRKIQDTLTDPNTPINSKMVVISGPGTVKDTIYRENFVDIYESAEIAGKRVVKMTRFASSANYEQYKTSAVHLRPGYFNEAKGAIDAWFLANPIYIDSRIDSRSTGEIFEQVFHGADASGEEEFQEIIKDSKVRIGYYLEAINAPVFDPAEIALRFNAVLKGAELAWKKINGFKEKIVNKVTSFIERTPVFRNIVEEVAWLGRQVVEQVMAACGMSGSFSLGSVGKRISGFFSGIVSKIKGIFGFAESDQYGSLEFECPSCKGVNRRPKGKLISNCQICGSSEVGC